MEGACVNNNVNPNFPPYFPTTTISPIAEIDSNKSFIITDIFVFLDTTWPYGIIVNYVNNLLQQLNINPYASAVTLLCANDGTVIVNRTHYFTTLYEEWNITTHSSFQQGFRLPYIFNAVRDSVEGLLREQVEAIKLGGQSVIVLLIPSAVAYVPEWDYMYSRIMLEKLNSTMPDINYLYFSGGAVVRWKDFVSNPHNDIFPIDPYQDINKAVLPVVKRILKIPRRIFNPGCYYTPVSMNLDMFQVMPIAGINFYRILPTYFYSNSGSSFLYIQANNGILLTVCTSRNSVIFRKTSAAQQGCQQVTPTAAFYLDMGSLCYNNLDLSDCKPFYFTVFAPTFADPQQVICLAPSCQIPYMVQYTIQIVNTACNKAFKTTPSTITCVFLYLQFILSLYI